MIIQCQGCAAKYFLPQDKVPADPIKVRCPKCRSVFMLEPRHEHAEVRVGAQAPAAPDIELTPPSPAPASIPSAAKTSEAAPKASLEDTHVVEPSAETPAETEEKPSKPARGGRSKEDRAKRLARVLVSDILWYNREKRDQALEDGTLMSTLGEDIKKSWELYKEKVGPEVANSTNYFKEALNEILADGQEVF